MLPALVMIAFVAVVGFLSWRLRDHPAAPKGCCGSAPWPPVDPSASVERAPKPPAPAE